MTRTGGDGVIYLSRVEMAPPGSTNAGRMVIAERHVIGDKTISQSRVGQPASRIWPDPDKAGPTGDVKNPKDESSAIANVPAGLNTLPLGESMYIAEVYYGADDLRFGPFWDGPLQLAAKVYY